jgi:hypothetical protein
MAARLSSGGPNASHSPTGKLVIAPNDENISGTSSRIVSPAPLTPCSAETISKMRSQNVSFLLRPSEVTARLRRSASEREKRSTIKAETINPHVRPAQASLALRPARSLNRPKRHLSRGSGPSDCSSKPLVSYQVNRQLSGWNLPPMETRALEAHHRASHRPAASSARHGRA